MVFGCSAEKTEQLSRIMDEVDPTVFSAHVPYEPDDFACGNETHLSMLLKKPSDETRSLWLIHGTLIDGNTRLLCLRYAAAT